MYGIKGVFFFLCYFSLIFAFESFYHLFNKHNSSCSNLLQSFYKPLDKLLVQQASKFQNVEISSFVKELLFLFITASWEKTQINLTTYYTYGNKKKWTQTFPYCNYGNKDRLLIQQANSKTLKSHPLSMNCCSSSSLHRERKRK